MDITEIIIRSYLLAALIGLVSFFAGKRIRSGKEIDSRVIFVSAAVLIFVGFLIALFGLIPLWANVAVAFIQSILGGIMARWIFSPKTLGRLENMKRRNDQT